ncbi:helix-turn-helix transcriptional regulator [bacterium]|nr:helix-turn-helix transcriptional regulator [bacterium]
MSKVFLKNVGNKIRELRNQKGFSQENLSEKLGISRNYMGMIERAEVNIPILTLYKIAKIFDVNPKDLLDF